MGKWRPPVSARLDEAFADALTASVGEGVYAIDLDGRLTFMNPAAAAIVGWSAEELLGREIHDILHRLDAAGNIRPESECPLLAVARTGVPVRFEDEVFVHRDGHLVAIACNSSPIVSDGETIGAVVAFHDITERKETEQRLRSEAMINETLLGIATMLNEQRDLPSVVQVVTDAGTAVSGAEVGAFFYVVADDRGETSTRCSISGVDRSAFDGVAVPRNAEVFEPTFEPEQTVRFDDVTAQPEHGSNPFAGLPEEHLQVRSYLAVPVVGADREPIGGLFFGHSEPGRFTETHERLVEAVAAHASVAIRNARRRELEQRVSETLQRSMLPRTLPAIVGIEAVARYLPAQEGIEVGGDWYDVVPLSGGRVALVIGDVAGHNVRAASIMAEVRNAVRAYAVEGHSPGGVVERTNRFLCALAPDELATCCYIELQPSEGTATIVLAGHPPPLVAGDERTAFAAAEPGVPLGVDAIAKFAETTVVLPPRATLVLYTDGLVEQVHVPLSEGMARLRAVVASQHRDLETAADSILVETAGVRTHDDAALLLVALTQDPVSDGIGRWLPCDAGSVSAARRFIGDVLSGWSLGVDVVAVARLLASELVTNAVLHTTGDIEIRLRRTGGALRVAVADESGERPVVLSPAAADSTSGRGLVLVDELSSRWGVEDQGVGKAVWFELELGT